MQISMKDTLCELRRQKKVTQEAVAAHLGITSQSVGKWERGEGFPDITLLPAIALYFGVTVDDLLGVDQARIDAKINEYFAESKRLMNAGEVEKNNTLWETALNEFPNDCRVMVWTMRAIERLHNGPPGKDKLTLGETLGKRVLAESEDSRQREEAIQLLVYFTSQLGNKDAAEQYAKMMGNYFSTWNEEMMQILEGDARKKQAKENVRDLLQVLNNNISRIGTHGTPEEIIRCSQAIITLFELVYEDGDYGFAEATLYQQYILMAWNYAKLGEGEKSLAALERAADFALCFDRQGSMTHTSFLVRGLSYDPDNYWRDSASTASEQCLIRMRNHDFDFLCETERFNAIVARLSETKE